MRERLHGKERQALSEAPDYGKVRHRESARDVLSSQDLL